MKRPLSPSVSADVETGSVPSLIDLSTSRIVGSLENEDSLNLYLSLVHHPNVRDLLRQRWRLKNTSPAHTLVCTKRRLVSADLVIHYLDTRELINNGGTLSQTKRTHTTPISVPHEVAASLTDLVLSKLQLEAQRSRNHTTPRFVLY